MKKNLRKGRLYQVSMDLRGHRFADGEGVAYSFIGKYFGKSGLRDKGYAFQVLASTDDNPYERPGFEGPPEPDINNALNFSLEYAETIKPVRKKELPLFIGWAWVSEELAQLIKGE